MLLFNWNWLRKPLQNYISKKTQREFTISHIDVDLGFTPTIKLKDVYFANADWAGLAMLIERFDFCWYTSQRY